MSRFADTLRRLEAELDVPYPERSALLAEIAGDLDAAFLAARRRGLSDAAARAAALGSLALDGAARDALADVHRTRVARHLATLSPRARRVAEWSAAGLPVLATLLYLFLEVPMLDIIREGGWGMYPVLLFGAIALISAARRAFVWLIARNHSPDALALHDSTPFHLAILTFFVGLLGTGTGCVRVLDLAARGEITPTEVMIGLRESLHCVLLATAFAILTIVVDQTARAALRRTGAPRP